jgi:hypothetical protein
MKLEKIVIDDVAIPICEKDLKVEEIEFGYSEETFVYEFQTPWIGLNQKNYRQYMEAIPKEEKNKILKKALIGNLLSMSKSLDYWLKKDEQIKAVLKLKERSVNLKGKTMTGFSGIIKTNFMIPDDVGIGKAVSRGFGTVRRVI